MLEPLLEEAVFENGETNTPLQERQVIAQGVVFSRSIRSSFCSIHIVPIETTAKTECVDADTAGASDCLEDDETEPMLIRVQFLNDLIALRSYFRRFCKHGDLIQVVSKPLPSAPSVEWQQPDADSNTGYLNPRLVVHVNNVVEATSMVHIAHRQYWTVRACQQWQQQYRPIVLPVLHDNTQRNRNVNLIERIDTEDDDCPDVCSGERPPPLWMEQKSRVVDSNAGVNESNCHHGAAAGIAKRMQAEFVASFLIHMMAQKHLQSTDSTCSSTASICMELPDVSQWARQHESLNQKSKQPPFWLNDVVADLNQDSGVFDVAGGSGHVSMCLALKGVRSTVIDPRESVGKLPRRDRRLFHRALNGTVKQFDKSTENETNHGEHSNTETMDHDPNLYCHPVAIPFDSLRAWFGAPPDGVDTSFRHPDQDAISILGLDRIITCTAIVALHPDEATDAIVDTAVRLRKPFVVVPCCVFNRLFPNRRKPNQPNEPVSTYKDLLEYLMAKDESIQKATLPFQGSNTILWSYFGRESMHSSSL